MIKTDLKNYKGNLEELKEKLSDGWLKLYEKIQVSEEEKAYIESEIKEFFNKNFKELNFDVTKKIKDVLKEKVNKTENTNE